MCRRIHGKPPGPKPNLPEPGWWKAFAVDKNVRSTRTPRRIAGDHEGALAKAPAVVETVRRDPEPRTPLAPAPLSEPVSESPVASRIAGLRSVFGTSPEHEGTGEKLDARIKALREASRAPADPETARDAGSLLTRSRKRESTPAIGQPEELSATASFGWMSARYAVEILAMSASFDMSDVSEDEDFDPIDAPAPADSAFQAPVAAPEIRDEPQVHAHGADFLWLYDKPQAINAATHAVMEPEPVAMPVVVAEETRSRVQLPAVVAPTPTIPAERPGWRASESYELPDLAYLAEPPASEGPVLTEDILEEIRRASRESHSGFRRQGRDHPCPPWTCRHALRIRARARYEIGARRRAFGRHRALHERHFGACRGHSGAQRHRHRTTERHARDGLPPRAIGNRGFQGFAPQAAALPRQDHRRRAGDRGSRPHAASARCRHHRIGQVGRHQHHDPVAALSLHPAAMPADHGRSEDAGIVGL